ncbi:MAG: hypothetical protein ABI067_17630 [Leifsonia sp.]
MNPWTIVSWIGAVCVAILVIALTVSIVISVTKTALAPKTTKQDATNIFTGK